MKSSRWRWPIFTVIITSFSLGALWGWKIVQDQAIKAGRAEVLSELNLVAPFGLFPQTMLLEFQKKERIRVVLHEERFPASLLRKALKSSPGQFDAAVIFHYQVSELRSERRMNSLFDSRWRFPSSISPDFRKLPDDRNLMDTAPLIWGLLGFAQGKNADEKSSRKFAFWPGLLIGGEPADLSPSQFVYKILPALSDLNRSANLMSLISLPKGSEKFLVSHATLAHPPFKDMQLDFSGVPVASLSNDPGFFLWVLTLVAMSDSNLENVRKFTKFLLEPETNFAFIQAARVGGTTLRDEESLKMLPESLRSSYLRRFSLNSIIVERDERLKQTDDLIEQAILGANIAPKISQQRSATEKAANEPGALHPVKAEPSIPQSHDD
jgi:spermidine/putrescine-binding protein